MHTSFKTFLSRYELNLHVNPIIGQFFICEGHEHRRAVETYNASQRKWVDDMVSACSVCHFIIKQPGNLNKYADIQIDIVGYCFSFTPFTSYACGWAGCPVLIY